MTTDTNLSQIVFNRLSNEKYHELKTSGQLNDQQFYITPDLDTNPGLIQDYMSNCITKIPQHINLELSTDGTLTLKAGSIVYVPNGFESDGITKKFDEVNINSDIIFTQPSNQGVNFIYLDNLGTALSRHLYTASGTVIPAEFTGAFYNTETNQIYYCNTGTGTPRSSFSFPIAIVTINENNTAKVASIDQVFNGIGYIGAVAFALPGVQVIIPDGFNSNGQLNNYTATVERVLTKDYAADGLLGHTLALTLTNSPLLSAGNMIYVEEENQMYKDSISELNKRTEVEIAKVTTDSTKITSLTPLPIYNRILNSTQVYETIEESLNKKITNCITKIPQDIKLTLSNGTLTLKAGSIIYYPDGFEEDNITKKFDKINISQDIIVSLSTGLGTTTLVLFSTLDGTTIGYRMPENCKSGTNDPEEGSRINYYNTQTNILTAYNGLSSSAQMSFPIAKISIVEDKITSIDQVFNGFGYIGSTVFALPDVEGLIPNGRNPDGSLNNTKFTTNSVLLFSPTTGTYNVLLTLTANRFFWNNSARYDQENNYNLNDVGIMPQLILGYANFVSGRITVFNPKHCFNAVDYYDFKQLDENIVHKTGDESIDGIKTYIGSQVIRGNSKVKMSSTGIDISILPTTTLYNFIDFMDKNNKRIGIVGARFNTDGYYGMYLQAGNEGNLSIISNGTSVMTSAPTPAAGSNNTNIATTNWVSDPNKSTNVVHRNATEEISGRKTLTTNLIRKLTTVETDTVPAQNQYLDFINIQDKNGVQVGYFGTADLSSGKRQSRMGVSRKKSDGTFVHSEIGIGTDSAGNVYTTTPTPALNSNSNDIVNTAWFNNKIKVVSTLPSKPDANVFYFVTNA